MYLIKQPQRPVPAAASGTWCQRLPGSTPSPGAVHQATDPAARTLEAGERAPLDAASARFDCCILIGTTILIGATLSELGPHLNWDHTNMVKSRSGPLPRGLNCDQMCGPNLNWDHFSAYRQWPTYTSHRVHWSR